MPDVQPNVINRVGGFRAAGVHAGLKSDGALDMALILSDRPCAAGGVFTQNTVKAAPVLFNMAQLQQNAASIRAVAVNTKIANALTGEQGMTNSRQMAHLVAETCAIQPSQVLVMSTGVIGPQLPMDKIQHGIDLARSQLGHNWRDAANGILTTDTRPKYASIRVYSGDGEYTIAGLTKGVGMIAPNMATMLAILVTDAKLSPQQVQTAIREASDVSYNRVVVDGDTSTNDMAVLLANGASGVTLSDAGAVGQFQQALNAVTQYLAKEVVRDGEGVTKFITLHVTGAPTREIANRVAHTIAGSPLVKTAFFGNDANWGRMIAAAGRAGVPFDPNRARLWMAPGEVLEEDRGLLLFENGSVTDYRESEATAIVKNEAIYVTLDMGDGSAQTMVWTCDLSHEYVTINADYRT